MTEWAFVAADEEECHAALDDEGIEGQSETAHILTPLHRARSYVTAAVGKVTCAVSAHPIATGNVHSTTRLTCSSRSSIHIARAKAKFHMASASAMFSDMAKAKVHMAVADSGEGAVTRIRPRRERKKKKKKNKQKKFRP